MRRSDLIIIVALFLMGCAGYDLVWNTGHEQVVVLESANG